MDTETLKPVRYTSIGYGPEPKISLEGFTKKELAKFEGFLHGMWWIRSNAGRLEFVPCYQRPPAPTEDPLLPGWRESENVAAQYQLELLPVEERYKDDSASILIQHLCGYNYSARNYALQVARLESWGFTCLRSRRGNDGKFWEVWFMPGLWAATGDLRTAIAGKSKEEKLDAAMQFLARNSSFGTLDLAVQRMCQVID